MKRNSATITATFTSGEVSNRHNLFLKVLPTSGRLVTSLSGGKIWLRKYFRIFGWAEEIVTKTFKIGDKLSRRPPWALLLPIWNFEFFIKFFCFSELSWNDYLIQWMIQIIQKSLRSIHVLSIIFNFLDISANKFFVKWLHQRSHPSSFVIGENMDTISVKSRKNVKTTVVWSLRNFCITGFLKNFRENNFFSKEFYCKIDFTK